MIEFGVVIAIIIVAWFYLRAKKETVVSSSEANKESVTTQIIATETEVELKSEPEQVNVEPVMVETGKAQKLAIVIPEDSMLRRHYMQNLTAKKACVETPFPEDSTLRRHYLQNLHAQQDNNTLENVETIAPADSEDNAIITTTATKIPEEAVLKRHFIQQIVAATEATMPLRPTDSTLKRHYDAQLLDSVMSQLEELK